MKINLAENPVNGCIRLFDGTGKIVRSFDVANQKEQIIIPAANLNTGLYLLELYIKDKKESSVKIAIIR